MRNFWKSSEHYQKNALFLFKYFFSLFVSNQRKTLFKIATLTFCVGDHIFFLCYLKNHMTFFWDFWLKLFENILKIFFISCSKIFKLIFCNHRLKILRLPPFILFKYSLGLFLRSWSYIPFWMKIRFARNLVKPSLIKN